MKFVDVTNDVAFKKIFGNEHKKISLISFLNAVLDLKSSDIITVLLLKHLINYPNTMAVKLPLLMLKPPTCKAIPLLLKCRLLR
ncbi:MAG: hypothetical protein EAZ51_09770 [Sphingobacteriales bacterium]|nr:MAG: hypothetical protein EAZ64_02255 [Sphingobacteriales bacterium]TAF78289.1 MAG: hypothetical protein EAZ51_09770 [Sphingobacteriales bacterium]